MCLLAFLLQIFDADDISKNGNDPVVLAWAIPPENMPDEAKKARIIATGQWLSQSSK